MTISADTIIELGEALSEQLSRIADALEGIEHSLKKIQDGSAVMSVDVGEVHTNSDVTVENTVKVDANCSGVVYPNH